MSIKHTTPAFIAKTAAIAALYAVLTYAIPAFSYGPIQFRVSEILTLLAFYHPRYVPGLTLGCAMANLFSPFGIVDVIFGALASFLATYAMSKSKNMVIASLFPALFSFIIGLEIYFLSAEPVVFWLVTAQIMASEIIVVTFIGVPFFKMLEKNDTVMRYIKNF